MAVIRKGMARHPNFVGFSLNTAILWGTCGLLCFAFLPRTSDAQQYNFSVIAGDIGFGSADGTNGAARFYRPEGITLDPSGSIYVADLLNDTIRRVTPVGTNWVSATLAGTPGQSGSIDGTNAAARFFYPSGIAEDSLGSLYVCEYGNHTVRQLTPVGTNWSVTTIAGLAGVAGSADGTNGDARFNSPRGMTIDPNGNLYVADTGNHTIRKLSKLGPDWVVTTFAGSAGLVGSTDGTNTSALFNSPEAVAADSSGNIYVADTLNCTFRKITPDGVVITIAGLAGNYGSTDGTGSAARFSYPAGVTIQAGTLFVADTSGGALRRIDLQGTNWVVTTLSGVRFAIPVGIAVTASTNLYVSASTVHTINQVTPVGTNWVAQTIVGTTSIGTADGTNSSARFDGPAGIAMDSTGTLYITEWYNQTIRRIVRQGTDYIVTTIAGTNTGTTGKTDGTNTQARFFYPSGVILDGNGNLIVADAGNNALRKITPVGTNWVTSTLQISASLQGPNSLAMDSGGQFIFVRTTALGTAKQSRFIDRIDFRTLFSWLGVRERQAAPTGPIATLGLDFRMGSPPILRPTFMSLTGGIKRFG